MGREQDRYGGALGYIPGQPKHAWREGLCIRLISVLLSGWSQAQGTAQPQREASGLPSTTYS